MDLVESGDLSGTCSVSPLSSRAGSRTHPRWNSKSSAGEVSGAIWGSSARLNPLADAMESVDRWETSSFRSGACSGELIRVNEGG